ncbi:hypothetical protein HZS_4233, partial [Henneguya salminicola]
MLSRLLKQILLCLILSIFLSRVIGNGNIINRYYIQDVGNQCAIEMISAPNGCANISLIDKFLTLTKIYLEGSDTRLNLYNNKILLFPKNLNIQHLMVNESWYILCGLDFLPSSFSLYLNYVNQNKEIILFCYKFYMDTSIHDNNPFQPVIFPQRYYHENIYMSLDEKNSKISRKDYSHIYDNLQAIMVDFGNDQSLKEVNVNKKHKLKTYLVEFKNLTIRIGPIVVEYERKNIATFAWNVH